MGPIVKYYSDDKRLLESVTYFHQIRAPLQLFPLGIIQIARWIDREIMRENCDLSGNCIVKHRNAFSLKPLRE